MNLIGVQVEAIDEAEEFVRLGGFIRVSFRFWFGGANVLPYEIEVAFACCG